MFSASLAGSVGGQMIELQALSALLASERALGRSRRSIPATLVALLGGIAVGWIVRGAS